MENNEIKVKPKTVKEKFFDKHLELSEKELIIEYLYNQERMYEKIESIRTNTSNLVWWLIVIPLSLGFLFGLFYMIIFK